MATCTRCKNDYDKTFELVTAQGEKYIFDSFECAIATVAPECATCGVRVIGHGVEVDGTIYCCAHCARGPGQTAVVADRADVPAQE